MSNTVRWCVEEADTGLPVASGCAQTPDEAYREMMHYVAQYSQDGEVRFWMRQNRKTIKALQSPASWRELAEAVQCALETMHPESAK